MGMSALVVTFLLIGGFALLLLILALLGGGHLHAGHLHVGHLHLGHLDLGHGAVGNGGAAGHGGFELSLPVIAGFLGAFGFGAAIAASLLPGGGAVAGLAAVVVGLVAAVPTAWLAGKLVNAAINISTDATLSSDDLIGTSGVVITPVPSGGYGEVRLAVGGQQMKFNARCDRPLALGTRIFVIAVPSPSSVLVEATPSIP
jgi:membrane protein implicated in regulation of membrane protease activity